MLRTLVGGWAAIVLGGLWMPGPSLAPKSVQFVAVVPDLNSAQPARIYLATSRDGWSPDAHPLPRVAPGIYAATIHLAAGLTVEYKFTRDGSWNSVEKSADGAELPNRTLQVEDGLEEQVVLHRIEAWADQPVPAKRRADFSFPGGATTQRASTLTGDIRTHYLVHSPQLHNARTVMVYLPPAYDDRPNERYPVLYLHDGQNLFDARTSFTGVEWGADETAERLIQAGRIERLILVGVYNNADRLSEYTFVPDPEHGGSGNADAYLAFLVDTLKPFIDEQYRTRPQREHTAIGGSSLGGLVSLYALYRHADTFGKAAVVSPSLQWADGAIFNYVRGRELPRPVRVWLDMGDLEGPRPESEAALSPAMQRCRELTELWTAEGYQPDLEFHFERVEHGQHHEADWARRFDRILTYLFPKTAE